MTFARIRQYVRTLFAPQEDPWAVTEAEFDEELRLSPEIAKEARLASAKHALDSGVSPRVVAAAFPDEVRELHGISSPGVFFSEIVTYKVFSKATSKATSKPFVKPVFGSGVVSPGMRFAIEVLAAERENTREISCYRRVANS